MKKIITACIIISILSTLIYIPSRAHISLVGDEEIFININESYFENGYKVVSLFNNSNAKVKISNNIDTTKVGTYEVVYTTENFGRKIQATRKVNVVDKEPPVIKLSGDQTIYIDLNEEYIEPGYVVYDNVDRKIAKNMNIISNVDSTKIGKYEITYTLSDLSGNTTTVTRLVEVINSRLLNSAPKDFWFEGIYEDVIIKPSNKQYNYIDDAIFIGDSNIRYLYLNGKYLTASQVWGKDNLNAVELTTSKIIVHENNKEMYIGDAIAEYKPKYLVVSFGMGSTLTLSKKNFLEYSEKFIREFKDKYPGTKLLVVSLPPIVNDTMYSKFQNKTNQFNYYLLELCAKYDIGYINIADELKAESGYGDPKYYVCNDEYDCGFHLNSKGKSLYIDYLKKIDMEKEI